MTRRLQLWHLTLLNTWFSIWVALVTDLPPLTRSFDGLRQAILTFRLRVVILKSYWAWAEAPLKTRVTPPLCRVLRWTLVPPPVPRLVVRLSSVLTLVGAQLSSPRKP